MSVLNQCIIRSVYSSQYIYNYCTSINTEHDGNIIIYYSVYRENLHALNLRSRNAIINPIARLTAPFNLK